VFIITAFGVLMMCFSTVMIVSPSYWSDGIIMFSKKTYFHWFEVFTRFTAGVVFVFFSSATLYPKLTLSIGFLLIAVAIGLLIVGPVKHRKFAVWSAYKFKSTFRPAGIVSFLFGLFLVYISTIGIVGN